MNHQATPSNQIQWPAPAWLRWLQISYAAMLIIVAGLVILTLWEIINQWWQGTDWLTALEQSVWVRPMTIGLIGWSYWRYRLKGRRPAAANHQPFLTYLDQPARHLFWRALFNYHQSGDNEFRVGHLLAAIANHPGFKLLSIRLNLTSSDITQLITQATDAINPILADAFVRASQDKTQIDWSHLLKGILSQSLAVRQILESKKIKPDEALAVVGWTKKDLGYRPPLMRSGLLHDLLTPQKNMNKTWTAKPTPVLDRFSKNLTDLAKLGWLASAKVRQSEVEQAVQILSKSQQNSLILVGEPGVGKTSIVGDIAMRMITGEIPALADYKLISLDLGAMIGSGGTSFQQLFSRAMQEAARSGNTILFIGNLDQLGKAKSGEGFDLSAILLDAMQNNQLQLIGTSDPLNYKKYIENNANLSTWFSRLTVGELDFDKAVLVLEDLSAAIESRQGVIITLDAIKNAVQLSQQYVHTGKLPDKAEDLLDEAAVYAARRGIKLVTASEVGMVMSTKTNVPIGEIDKAEKEKLADLTTKIHQRLIGQDEAVTAVAEALKRSRLGVSATGKRPIGTFLFLGPTGVGKTELAKSLAWAYFGDENKIIRLDMGEYQTRESVSNLAGAPLVAGDIALAGGSFTEKVKQTPFTVVLLDEIEKAHDEILNIFLRVLDEGKMTDNLGNEVDFTHTIIIATSNADARFIEESVRQGLPYATMQKELIQRLTQTEFKPEFINRFDGVIVFKPLIEAEIEQITRLKLGQLQKRLKINKQIDLQVTEEAIQALAAEGFDPAFGARPLERLIREKIESKIANALLTEADVKVVQVDKTDILS